MEPLNNSKRLEQSPIPLWKDNFIGLFYDYWHFFDIAELFVTFLYGNPPKQFVQIAFLKVLQYFCTAVPLCFLKYYTQTIHWIHLLTYSLGCQGKDEPGETVYLQKGITQTNSSLTLSWLSNYINIDSFFLILWHIIYLSFSSAFSPSPSFNHLFVLF